VSDWTQFRSIPKGTRVYCSKRGEGIKVNERQVLFDAREVHDWKGKPYTQPSAFGCVRWNEKVKVVTT